MAAMERESRNKWGESLFFGGMGFGKGFLSLDYIISGLERTRHPFKQPVNFPIFRGLLMGPPPLTNSFPRSSGDFCPLSNPILFPD